MDKIKNYVRICLFTLGGYAVVFPACTLDKEPEIPNYTNEQSPLFSSMVLIPDTNDNFLAIAHLSSQGNLNILHHGWVWSDAPGPSLLDSKLVMDSLKINMFSAQISDLDRGKPYFMRPFVITGADTIYGPEKCSFLGVNIRFYTDASIFQGAEVQFENISEGDNNYSWDFGDGTMSTELSPLHVFSSINPLTVVRLAATNKNFDSCTVLIKRAFNVQPSPFESNYWVGIPGGTFTMGCTADQNPVNCLPDEFPTHLVTLDAFIMGKHEITQRQWEAVVGTMPSANGECLDCPVETVSWKDIDEKFLPAYKRKTGKTVRLPTEAQWEYAARGDSSTRYSGANDADLVAWSKENSVDETQVVGGKAPNNYGLFDMSGNVWEWCQDWYGPYQATPQTNPVNLDSIENFRVARGGSWFDDSLDCNVGHRYKGFKPDNRYFIVGFRLVRDP